jgi:hypothetical protein
VSDKLKSQQSRTPNSERELHKTCTAHVSDKLKSQQPRTPNEFELFSVLEVIWILAVILYFSQQLSCMEIWEQEVYTISWTISMYNPYQHRKALRKITKDLMVQNRVSKESYNPISSLSF